MAIRVVRKNTLVFDDGSLLEIPKLWVGALRDKLMNEKLTFEDFLSNFDNWIMERWEARTSTEKSLPPIGHWPRNSIELNELLSYGNKAELAEKGLYHYLRGYILGLLLFELAGGERRTIIVTEKGLSEYPPRKRKRHQSRKRK